MMGIKAELVMDSEPNTPERKTYIVVKNHVREIPIVKADETTHKSSSETEKESKAIKKKNIRSRSSSESENSTSEITENDLNELRNVYNKCKAVMKKIEAKYGHLLEIDEPSCSRINKHSLSSNECHCGSKRKIVYDDDGKRVYQNVDAEHHICPTNVQSPNKRNLNSPEFSNVSIEDETSYELPDTIPELTIMLQEQKLSNYLKYQIMLKMKNIRQDHLNSLRYEKPKLVEKLKSNPIAVFEFEGSNLPLLPGYPVDKKS